MCVCVCVCACVFVFVCVCVCCPNTCKLLCLDTELNAVVGHLA